MTAMNCFTLQKSKMRLQNFFLCQTAKQRASEKVAETNLSRYPQAAGRGAHMLKPIRFLLPADALLRWNNRIFVALFPRLPLKRYG